MPQKAEKAKSKARAVTSVCNVDNGTMATLLPSLSSDEEGNNKALKEKDSDSSDDEVVEEFDFGGILVGVSTVFLCVTSLW